MFDSIYQFMQYMPERFEIASRSSGLEIGLGLGHVFIPFRVCDRVSPVLGVPILCKMCHHYQVKPDLKLEPIIFVLARIYSVAARVMYQSEFSSVLARVGRLAVRVVGVCLSLSLCLSFCVSFAIQSRLDFAIYFAIQSHSLSLSPLLVVRISVLLFAAVLLLFGSLL